MQVYLDHNATTPILPAVVEHMAEVYRRAPGNAASQHEFGRQSRRVVEEARQTILALLGARQTGRLPDRLIFTSGGTESNNLAIVGQAGDEPGLFMISPIEHASVNGPVDALRRRGWQVAQLTCSRSGVVELDLLEKAIVERSHGPTRASLMLGNNETGVLQPVAQAAPLCRRHEIPLHTDGVQVVGKLPVNFSELGVASLSFSAHKFHGPRGIGGLLLRGDTELHPILYGGFQQAGLRPGTEPVALVAGMARALEIWQREQIERLDRITRLRDRFEDALRLRMPEVLVNGAEAPRLPHTSNVSFPGFDRRTLAMALDLEGVACSTGSACASGSSEPSPVLLAMGLATGVVASSLRFSLGATTTEAEIDCAVQRIATVIERLRGRPSDH